MPPSPASRTIAQAARIPDYAYAAPTEADARAALLRVFGDPRGADEWVAACRTAGVAPGFVGTPVEMQRVMRALAARGGASATVARSIDIRMRTFERLAARGTNTGTGR